MNEESQFSPSLFLYFLKTICERYDLSDPEIGRQEFTSPIELAVTTHVIFPSIHYSFSLKPKKFIIIFKL